MTDTTDWPGHPDADHDCECCLGDGLQADGETPCPCIEMVAEALKPFADMISYIEADTPDDYRPSWAEFLTVGDFRRAAAAMRALKGDA